jgi:hypothetical protein
MPGGLGSAYPKERALRQMYAGRGRRDYAANKRVSGVQNSHANWANSGHVPEEDPKVAKRKAKAAASKTFMDQMEETYAGMYADADEGQAGGSAIDSSVAALSDVSDGAAASEEAAGVSGTSAAALSDAASDSTPDDAGATHSAGVDVVSAPGALGEGEAAEEGDPANLAAVCASGGDATDETTCALRLGDAGGDEIHSAPTPRAPEQPGGSDDACDLVPPSTRRRDDECGSCEEHPTSDAVPL